MNANTNAILLLTSHFSRNVGSEQTKPLTPGEWGRFALWLREHGLAPAGLLEADIAAQLDEWRDKSITSKRVAALLGRGHALALAMEKWSRAGIWVMTRSDAEYPRLLKQRLKNAAPAVLYGCGNRNLLNAAGIAVIGSRNAGEADLADAHLLGQRIALGGYAVVSGGARGVDETAMLGGLAAGGTAVGVFADNLLAAATSRKWRAGLLEDDLALVSPYHPEAAFSTGNAMGRNKYVYCLSRAAIVAHSGSSGGTWAGAEENLGKVWVPLWVKPTQDPSAANAQLVQKGGKWLPAVETLDVVVLCAEAGQMPDQAQMAGGMTCVAEEELEYGQVLVPDEERVFNNLPKAVSVNEAPMVECDLGKQVALVGMVEQLTFYDLFLRKLDLYAQDFSAQELADALNLPRKLVDEWLVRAVAEGGVVQSGKRPAKYRAVSMDLMS